MAASVGCLYRGACSLYQWMDTAFSINLAFDSGLGLRVVQSAYGIYVAYLA